MSASVDNVTVEIKDSGMVNCYQKTVQQQAFVCRAPKAYIRVPYGRGLSPTTLATEEAEHIQTPENETEPVTDGEFVAWAQVLGSHLTIVNSWGYVSAFDAFQTWYCELLSRPASDVSWIGSIQVFLLFFIGTFSDRAADAGYLKLAWSIGAPLGCARHP
ncbi:hypothetical protein CRV24_009521 [Beauveria bassiana]|nr:hypothetical protein CRV24_009521 [Beauveria bassiana]